jgi:hypothetical protein
MMRSITLLLIAAALVGTLFNPTQAEARRRAVRHSQSEGNALVVPRRSFLDAGVVVAPGSNPNYAISTQMTPPIYSFDDRFTRNLPSPYFMPGRPQPLFQFETPGQ